MLLFCSMAFATNYDLNVPVSFSLSGSGSSHLDLNIAGVPQSFDGNTSAGFFRLVSTPEYCPSLTDANTGLVASINTAVMDLNSTANALSTQGLTQTYVDGALSRQITDLNTLFAQNVIFLAQDDLNARGELSLVSGKVDGLNIQLIQARADSNNWQTAAQAKEDSNFLYKIIIVVMIGAYCGLLIYAFDPFKMHEKRPSHEDRTETKTEPKVKEWR